MNNSHEIKKFHSKSRWLFLFVRRNVRVDRWWLRSLIINKF